ncbi:MAG: hypothetical protein ACRC0A_00740 [Chitinophagaceae bacterium]
MKKFVFVIIYIAIGFWVFAQEQKTTPTDTKQIGFKPYYSPVENKFSIGVQLGVQLNEFGGGLQITSPDLWKNSGVKLRVTGNSIVFNTFNDAGSTLMPYFDTRLGILKSFELYETISIYTEIGGVMTFNNTKNTTIHREESSSTVKMTNKKFGYGGYLKCGMEIRPKVKYGIFFEMGGILTTNFAEQIKRNSAFFANGYMINVGNRFYF